MKKQTIIGLVTVLVVLTGGYMIYKTKFWIQGVKSKAEAIVVLVNSGKSQNVDNALDKMQDGYLISWANAVLKNQKEFSFQGTKYNTVGGKSIKK